jgi:3-oxoacyl-[acyl-carrier-protein] synthase II
MSLKRVVITGVGGVSPLGPDIPTMLAAMADGQTSVRRMDEWMTAGYQNLRSWVAAPAVLQNEKKIPREARRSMGRMSIFAAQAAEQAFADAGITADDRASGRFGCIVGSTMGSSASINEMFESFLPSKDFALITSMRFFQCMPNTVAMNLANCYGINGWAMAPSAACASALQAIGAAYDLVRLGRQDAVLCGGAEELHPTVTGSFDVLFATSTHFNDRPSCTPRPFDRDRDGLVCGEGAGLVILEEYEHARRRGAKIYAEISGYSTCASGLHVSQSNGEAMARCMRDVLAEAKTEASAVDFINAHATGTPQGDKEEAEALAAVFGPRIPVNSLKGYLGHTLGASGALELIAALSMMERGVLLPTLNLENVADDCGGVYHLQQPLEKTVNVMVKNSFGFGGINTAMVCRRV